MTKGGQKRGKKLPKRVKSDKKEVKDRYQNGVHWCKNGVKEVLKGQKNKERVVKRPWVRALWGVCIRTPPQRTEPILRGKRARCDAKMALLGAKWQF